MKASSDDQNSFARRKPKFNPNMLVKLSSPLEMVKKEKEKETGLAKGKAPKEQVRMAKWDKTTGTVLERN